MLWLFIFYMDKNILYIYIINLFEYLINLSLFYLISLPSHCANKEERTENQLQLILNIDK